MVTELNIYLVLGIAFCIFLLSIRLFISLYE